MGEWVFGLPHLTQRAQVPKHRKYWVPKNTTSMMLVGRYAKIFGQLDSQGYEAWLAGSSFQEVLPAGSQAHLAGGREHGSQHLTRADHMPQTPRRASQQFQLPGVWVVLQVDIDTDVYVHVDVDTDADIDTNAHICIYIYCVCIHIYICVYIYIFYTRIQKQINKQQTNMFLQKDYI